MRGARGAPHCKLARDYAHPGSRRFPPIYQALHWERDLGLLLIQTCSPGAPGNSEGDFIVATIWGEGWKPGRLLIVVLVGRGTPGREVRPLEPQVRAPPLEDTSRSG